MGGRWATSTPIRRSAVVTRARAVRGREGSRLGLMRRSRRVREIRRTLGPPMLEVSTTAQRGFHLPSQTTAASRRRNSEHRIRGLDHAHNYLARFFFYGLGLAVGRARTGAMPTRHVPISICAKPARLLRTYSGEWQSAGAAATSPTVGAPMGGNCRRCSERVCWNRQ